MKKTGKAKLHVFQPHGWGKREYLGKVDVGPGTDILNLRRVEITITEHTDEYPSGQVLNFPADICIVEWRPE